MSNNFSSFEFLNILHPIIIELYLIKRKLFFLENSSDNISSIDDCLERHDDIFLVTDRFYRVYDKCIKKFNTAEKIDCLVLLFEKNKGVT